MKKKKNTSERNRANASHILYIRTQNRLTSNRLQSFLCPSRLEVLCMFAWTGRSSDNKTAVWLHCSSCSFWRVLFYDCCTFFCELLQRNCNIQIELPFFCCWRSGHKIIGRSWQNENIENEIIFFSSASGFNFYFYSSFSNCFSYAFLRIPNTHLEHHTVRKINKMFLSSALLFSANGPHRQCCDRWNMQILPLRHFL